MARFLLIIAMFCAIAAAGLGFYNRDKLTRLTQDLASSVNHTKQLQASLDDLQKKMQQMGQQIESQERANEQQRDAMNSDLHQDQARPAHGSNRRS
jgi:predicted PurR-regulated permease PerM